MNSQNSNPDITKIEKCPSDVQDIFIPEGQRIKVSDAINWIGDAWSFISTKLGVWVLMGITYSIIEFSIMLIPKLGFILFNLLEPVFIAGIIAICETQRTTGKFKFRQLFYGFRHKFGALLKVGMVVCGIKVFGYLLVALIEGEDLYRAVFDDFYSAMNYNDDSSEFSFLSLGITIIYLFLTTAYSWFSPALIILNNVKFKQAIITSFNVVCENIGGIILFFIIIYILIVISGLPLLIGLLFTTPLYMATSYSSYRSIFYKKEVKNNEVN
ncbi:BPSS1780 family membrane protein [Xenorhabdus innexi]|uniref:Membrane protein n=1 Tax=Xenorhabdus innexi TaxID=290109 RepID=A0A1N6MZI6_9GAMM|nr:BPSS1780 family membrane protein [Xenorhabdus innexi]PHM37890.1 membrane protein [Xenorhabdus innexi]SIP74278.1 putative Similar to transmembrane protein [Xenorhabdus innexi]